MSRRAAAIALALLGVSCRPAPPGDPPPRRSIVVVTVDTLRADRLGSYGHSEARTPVLDALASRGASFAAATTPFPRTTPALASVMTGLLPWRHGSREVGQPMAATLTTLPSMLRDRGYTTLAVCVNGAAGPDQNLDLGFDRFLDYRSFGDHTAAGVTDATLGLLEEVLGPAAGAPGGDAAVAPAPLFLWVHYIDPHFPYAPPQSWTDQPGASTCRELVARTGDDLAATALVRIDHGGEASAALADCSALYDAEVAYTDAQIGRLLDALEARGVTRDGYLVFTSDHGENLGEDGLFFEHGPSVNDASLRVPLLIAGPGIVPGVDREVARLEDLAPTLLSLVGVPAEAWPDFDGVDLTPRLTTVARDVVAAEGAAARADASAPAAVAESGGALLPQSFNYITSGRPGDRQCVNGARFSLCTDPGGPPRLYDHVEDPLLEHDLGDLHPEAAAALAAVRRRWPPGVARERTLRTARYKLVQRPEAGGGFRVELYDLERDPGETRDVADSRPELVRELRARLEAAFTGVDAAAAPELGPAELDALRNLGYVR